MFGIQRMLLGTASKAFTPSKIVFLGKPYSVPFQSRTRYGPLPLVPEAINKQQEHPWADNKGKNKNKQTLPLNPSSSNRTNQADSRLRISSQEIPQMSTQKACQGQQDGGAALLCPPKQPGKCPSPQLLSILAKSGFVDLMHREFSG